MGSCYDGCPCRSAENLARARRQVQADIALAVDRVLGAALTRPDERSIETILASVLR